MPPSDQPSPTTSIELPDPSGAGIPFIRLAHDKREAPSPDVELVVMQQGLSGGESVLSDALLGCVQALKLHATLDAPLRREVLRNLGIAGIVEGLQAAVALTGRGVFTAFVKLTGGDEAARRDTGWLIHASFLCAQGFDGTQAREFLMSEMRTAAEAAGATLSGESALYDPDVPDYMAALVRALGPIETERARSLGAYLLRNAGRLGAMIDELASTFDPLYLAIAFDIAAPRVAIAAFMNLPPHERDVVMLGIRRQTMQVILLNIWHVAEDGEDYFDDRGWVRLMLQAIKYACVVALARLVAARRTDPDLPTIGEPPIPYPPHHDGDLGDGFIKHNETPNHGIHSR